MHLEAVVFVVVVFVIVLVTAVIVGNPRNPPLKYGQNRVSKSSNEQLRYC